MTLEWRASSIQDDAMPIRHTIYHPDRVVTGIATGEIALIDLIAFAKTIADDGLEHYRKILDVIDARPTFSAAELKALTDYMRDHPVQRRGAVAFVVGQDGGEFARLFASFEMHGRPIQLFRSIHDARQWIAENPPPKD